MNLKTDQNSGLREKRYEGGKGLSEPEQARITYEEYQLSLGEWLQAMGIGFGSAGVVAYTFYRSWAAFGILLLPALSSPWIFRERLKRKRFFMLEQQFKETIQMLSASLSAGYSVENAITASRKELELMYGKKGLMLQELDYMIRQMDLNQPVEALMSDFADRSGLEEVENFARIFAIAKRSGGRLVPIISHTVQVMNDRFQVKEEIRTLTASRKMEQNVMNGMPFLIILYINITSPGFFTVMYTTIAGRLVMSGCLAVCLLSCCLAKKILDIQP